jgi:hypothetical protein
MKVVINNPEYEGKYAVTAVAHPRAKRDKRARFISFRNKIRTITPTAKNPGISLTPCSQPILTPSNLAISITKLLSNADQVENDIGIAIDIRINRKIG